MLVHAEDDSLPLPQHAEERSFQCVGREFVLSEVGIADYDAIACRRVVRFDHALHVCIIQVATPRASVCPGRLSGATILIAMSNLPKTRVGARELTQIMVAYEAVLSAHRQAIDSLNVFPVPDGDTGTNMAMTVASVVKEIEGAGIDETEAAQSEGVEDGKGAKSAGSGIESEMKVVCQAISHGSLMGARGNSGVILCQILRGLSKSFEEAGECTPKSLADGLELARQSAYDAVLEPKEGTILTVLKDTAEEARVSEAEGSDLTAMADRCKTAGQESLERTPELLEVLAEAGVVDAGGAGLVLFWDAVLSVVDGRELPEPLAELPGVVGVEGADGADGASVGGAAAHVAAAGQAGEAAADRADGAAAGHASGAGAVDAGEQRYEVMYFLETPDDDISVFKEAWGGIGDSIVVVGGDGLWNCHIHTNDIGAAIEAGIEVGRPRQIRITDLFEQVEHIESDMLGDFAGSEMSDGTTGAKGLKADDGANDGNEIGAASHPENKGETAVAEAVAPIWMNPDCARDAVCAVISVAAGEGIRNLMGMLGVHGVVSGGQSMNPSTELLLQAIESVSADEAVLLPNNKNIIPVAHQAAAAAMSSRPRSDREASERSMPDHAEGAGGNSDSGKKVLVLETASIPEGIAALSAYDPEAGTSENLAAMQAEIAELSVGEVTQAVRTTKVEGREISEGDFIAMSGGKILSAAASPADATCELLDEIITPEHELLTLFAGEPAAPETTRKLLSWLKENHPHIEVETHDGGQPLYHYYLSLF